MIRGRRGSSPDGGGGGPAAREQYRPNESDPDACSTLTQSEGIHFLAKVYVSLLGGFCVFCWGNIKAIHSLFRCASISWTDNCHWFTDQNWTFTISHDRQFSHQISFILIKMQNAESCTVQNYALSKISPLQNFAPCKKY